MLACLGAIIAELCITAIVSNTGGNAPTHVNVRIVNRTVYCWALAHAEFGVVVGEGSIGRRTPVDAQISCGITSIIIWTVERIDAGPVSSAAVG